MDPIVTTALIYFALGTGFGLLSWTRRHLFSEGHSRRTAPGEDDGWGSRVVWVLLCSGLWPLMALTGVYGAWHRRHAK